MEDWPEVTTASVEILERALVVLQADPTITDWAVPILRARVTPIPGNTFAGDSTVPGEAGAVIALATDAYGPGSGVTAVEANDTLDRLRLSHDELVRAYREALANGSEEDDY